MDNGMFALARILIGRRSVIAQLKRVAIMKGVNR